MAEIKLDCSEAQHEEASEYPDHPCWGWMTSHTYPLSKKVIPQSMEGKLRLGPSERTGSGVVHIEGLTSEGWEKLSRVHGISYNNTTPFDTSLPEKKIEKIRFKAEDDAYIDRSIALLKTKEETGGNGTPPDGENGDTEPKEFLKKNGKYIAAGAAGLVGLAAIMQKRD